MEINNGKNYLHFPYTTCLIQPQHLAAHSCLVCAAAVMSCPHGALMAHPNPHQTKRTVQLLTAHHPRAASQHFHCSYNDQRCFRGISLSPFWACAFKFMNWLAQTIPKLFSSSGSCCQPRTRSLILKHPSEFKEWQGMFLSFDCSLGGDTCNI